MRLRQHQQELANILSELSKSDLPVKILANVVPGGGKSKLPGLIMQRFPDFKLAWFVPRQSLARQAAIGLKADFDIDVRCSTNEINPSRGTRGFIATHTALATQPDLWRDEMIRSPYILVVDELHHAKIERSGNKLPLAKAIQDLPYKIMLGMTGTLETNDNTFIYGVDYKETARGWIPDFSESDTKVITYDRISALQENAIVTVEFHYHDGPVKWENSDGEQENTLSMSDRKQESQAIMTALRTDLADQLLENCVENWQKNGRQNGRKLLVVTADQKSAKKYHGELKTKGINSGLAISDEDTSLQTIVQFQKGGVECLVTCMMAYEGLDVPNITHLACLTHIRSKPWILQMLARAWRQTPKHKKNKCWIFVPDDPKINRVIAEIKSEDLKVIPLPLEGPGRGKNDGIFIPISGEVENINRQMLDHVDESSEEEEIISKLWQASGLSTDDPRFKAFADAIKNSKPNVPPKSDKTIDEKEKELRTFINDLCNKANFDSGSDHGTYQRKLLKRTKKPLPEQTLSELQKSRKICIEICSQAIASGRVESWV